MTTSASRSLTENELVERENAQYEKCLGCRRARPDSPPYDVCRSDGEQWVPLSNDTRQLVDDWQICVTARGHGDLGHPHSLRAVHATTACVRYQRRPNP